MRTRGFVSAVCLGIAACLTGSIAESAPFTPQVITDPYPGIQWPNGNFDVIGAREGFDIESLTLTKFDVLPTPAAAVSLKVRFNYSKPEDYGKPGNYALTSLNDYLDFGIPMSVGDLLFAPDDPQPGLPPYPTAPKYPAYKYGVALHDHDGLQAGDLYKITSTRDSNFYLDPFDPTHTHFVWNFGAPVRMNPTGAQFLSDGSVNVSAVGGPEVEAVITFAQNSEFQNDWLNGGLLAHFVSAICANDEINGFIGPVPGLTQVPAPAGLVLLLTGVGSLIAFRRRRAA